MDASPDLRLLSLDGGGVRGLSTLYILKNLLQKVAGPGQPLPKPCDYFDMIGGTSTGGLIAIMLGRLGMSVDECISSYLELSKEVFGKKRSRYPLNYKLELATQFDARRLEEVIKSFPGAEELLASDETAAAKCKVFVCALRKSNSRPALLRSWSTLDANDLLQHTTVWQACRATSAAPTFFDPIAIGPAKQELIDGGMGYNNPVEVLYAEARKVWGPDDAKFQQRIMCLVSIGTGLPKPKTLEPGLRQTLKTLSKMVSDTQSTADRFRRDKDGLSLNGQYFRFNVDIGLQGIGLEEYEKQNTIADATSDYMDRPEVQQQLLACANSLRERVAGGEDPPSHNVPCTIVQTPSPPAVTAPSPQPPTPPQETTGPETTSPSRYSLKFSLAGVPFSDRFVDRPENMEAIKSRLLPSRRDRSVLRRNIYVLHGMGGIGKTQLAANFFTGMGKEFSAAFWLRGNTERDLRQSIVKSARRIPSGQIPETSRAGFAVPSSPEEAKIIEDFLDWLGDDENTDWLLVFDNVDLDLDAESDQFAGAFDVMDYLPAGHGAALVTTRLSRLAQLGGDDDGEAKLRPTDQKLSRAIFLKWFGKANIKSLGKDYEQSIDALVGQDMLDGLPLAIAQAAVYIKRTGIDIHEYKRRYDKMWPMVMATAGNTTPIQGYQNSVGTTWSLSLKQVEARSPYAGKLVRMWAFLDHRDFCYDLLQLRHEPPVSYYYGHDMPEGLTKSQALEKYKERDLPIWLKTMSEDVKHYLESVDILLNFALIEPTQLSTHDSDESDQGHGVIAPSYSMHPVVHSWSMQTQSDAEKVDALRNALRLFIAPADFDRWHWEKKQWFLRHADRLYEWVLAEESDEAVRHASAVQTIADLAHIYTLVGHPRKTIKLCDVVQPLDRKRQASVAGDPMPRSLLWSIAESHGLALYHVDRLAESADKLKGALKILSDDPGSLRQGVITRLQLSRVELSLGRPDEAEKLLEQVQKKFDKILKESRIYPVYDMAQYFFHVGRLYRCTNRPHEAEKYYLKARLGGLHTGCHFLEGEALDELASLCQQKADIKMMMMWLEKLLKLKTDVLISDYGDPVYSTFINTCARLACGAAAQGEEGKMEKMLDLAFFCPSYEIATTWAICDVARFIRSEASKREMPMQRLTTPMRRAWDEGHRMIRMEKHRDLDHSLIQDLLFMHRELTALYKETGREEEAEELGRQIAQINLRAE